MHDADPNHAPEDAAPRATLLALVGLRPADGALPERLVWARNPDDHATASVAGSAFALTRIDPEAGSAEEIAAYARDWGVLGLSPTADGQSGMEPIAAWRDLVRQTRALLREAEAREHGAPTPGDASTHPTPSDDGTTPYVYPSLDALIRAHWTYRRVAGLDDRAIRQALRSTGPEDPAARGEDGAEVRPFLLPGLAHDLADAIQRGALHTCGACGGSFTIAGTSRRPRRDRRMFCSDACRETGLRDTLRRAQQRHRASLRGDPVA